jgi:uncharacterized small protein (DUF1192 family)
MALVDSPKDVEKLKKQLRKRVMQAVDAVCGEWVKEQAQMAPAEQTLDRSYGSCRALVGYIAANMATSPGFVEQMERIILGCFSGASKRVLSTVATEEVWFRVEKEQQTAAKKTPREGRGPGGHTKPVKRTTTSSKAVTAAPAAKTAADEPFIKEERVEVGASPADGAQREVAGSLLEKRPRSRTSKKKLSTKKPLQALAVPETKKKLVARRRSEASSAEESAEVEAETETDEDQEDQKRPKKRPTTQKKRTQTTNAVAVEDAQGLLTFEEAIGELCYQERRTPEQTEFFKERLRKSIQLVDALLCHPPPGKVCTWTCAKIRGCMCKGTAPCQDQTCRIWHDVEAHTDRCQNAKCEFKLRILVRETMHKLHSKQLEVMNASQKLRRKNAALDDLNVTELSEPGTFADSIAALESEIEKLEQALVEKEAGMAQINETLETYWATLNEIGIESRHDEIDKFPEFVAHYANKKKRR